jgi:hypothetical protein
VNGVRFPQRRKKYSCGVPVVIFSAAQRETSCVRGENFFAVDYGCKIEVPVCLWDMVCPSVVFFFQPVYAKCILVDAISQIGQKNQLGVEALTKASRARGYF